MPENVPSPVRPLAAAPARAAVPSWLLAFLVIPILAACSDSDDPTGPLIGDLDLDIPPNPLINETSSYTNQLTDLWIDWHGIRVHPDPGLHFILALGYGDFNGNGLTDVVMAPGDGSDQPSEAELYLNDGEGGFVRAPFEGAPSLVHGRKALVADFNGDGRDDVFLLDHGYDGGSQPGAHPYLLLQTEEGGLEVTGDFSQHVGFLHGGAAADVTGSGDVDVFVGNIHGSFFLINDGAGGLTRDESRLDPQFETEGVFTAELIDLEDNGYADLLIAGHEYQDTATRILWGSSRGVYDMGDSTILPEVPGWGTVVDIDAADFTGNGHRDLVLTRTGAPPNFYEGYYLQVLEGMGDGSYVEREPIIDEGAQWIEWIRLQDFNGNGFLDIVVDDAARGLVWLNDGAGGFVAGP